MLRPGGAHARGSGAGEPPNFHRTSSQHSAPGRGPSPVDRAVTVAGQTIPRVIRRERAAFRRTLDISSRRTIPMTSPIPRPATRPYENAADARLPMGSRSTACWTD